MTRLVKKLVEFECNALVLADALNLGTDDIVFLPHNEHMMITNFGGVYSTFKVMNKDVFDEYKMNIKVKDEWFSEGDVSKLRPIVISRAGIIKLLDKIQGRVKISIESPDEGELRYVIVEDLVGKEEKFEGRFKMKERDIMDTRLLARYVEYFDKDELMIPKISLLGGDCHILKIKEGLSFSPLIISKDYKQFVTSIVSKTPDEFDVQVFNSSLEDEYTANYSYDFLQSTNEEKFQKYKDHQKTYYKFPANPQTMELVLKFQSAQPKYITIIEVDDDIAPFFVFFSSVKDMGNEGKIYTSSLLYLEGETNIEAVVVKKD